MSWSKLIFFMIILSVILIPTTSATPAFYYVICNVTISKGVNVNQSNITVNQCFGYSPYSSTCDISTLKDRIHTNMTYTINNEFTKGFSVDNTSSIQEGNYIIKGGFWGGFSSIQKITDNRSLDAIAQEDCSNYAINSFINSGEIYLFSPLILCVAFAFIKKPSKKIKFLSIDWRKLSLCFLLMFTLFMGFEFFSLVPTIIPFPINYLIIPFGIIGLILAIPAFIVISLFSGGSVPLIGGPVPLQYMIYFIAFFVYPLFLSLGIFYLYDNVKAGGSNARKP